MKLNYDYSVLRKHISPTFLTSMVNCPMEVFLNRILRVPVQHAAKASRSTGLLVHKTLEESMQRAIESKTPPSKDEILEIISEIRQNEDLFYRDVELPIDDIDLAKELSIYIDDSFGRDIKLRSDDIIVETDIPDVKVYGMETKGRMDLKIGGKIIDYKVKLRKLPGNKQFSVEKNVMMQGLFYIKAFNAANINVEEFEVHNLYLTKKKGLSPEIKTYRASELEIVEDELRDLIEYFKVLMKTGLFPRNYASMFCPCDAVEYCQNNDKIEEYIKSLNLKPDVF